MYTPTFLLEVVAAEEGEVRLLRSVLQLTEEVTAGMVQAMVFRVPLAAVAAVAAHLLVLHLGEALAAPVL